MTVDLSVDYLRLELRSPLVASASPLTGSLENLQRLEEAGIGAVVLPSLFEEEIEHDAIEVDRFLSTGEESYGEAHTYFPELYNYDTGPDRYLDLVERARERLGVPVIASLNGITTGWWSEFARRLEDAGACAIEVNVYFVAADGTESGEHVERRYLDLVEEITAAVHVPVAVKVGPYFSSLSHMAGRLCEAGASGLVLFNRFYQPDIDLDTLSVTPRLVLSHSEELRLPLRWIALLRGRLDASLAASTGVHTAEDALKALLAGADVTMMTSALLQNGPEHVAKVEGDIRVWMQDNEYPSIRILRGSVSAQAVPDPSAYARGNYLQMLRSYSGPYAD